MASPQRRATYPLAALIRGEPQRFEFFQLVRALTWASSSTARTTVWTIPAAALGGDLDPNTEVLRFRNTPKLIFPWAQVLPRSYGVLSTVGSETGQQFELVAAIMGLVGAGGVLPEHYTETLLDLARRKETIIEGRESERESALQVLFDTLSHRSVSFYYRAWAKYRLPCNWEQGRRSGSSPDDPFSTVLRSLLGFGTLGLSERLGVQENFPIYYGGLGSRRIRSAAALKQMLRTFLALPVEILEFRGRWLILQRPDQTRLPTRAGKSGQHTCLGFDAIAGDKVWDVCGNIRIRVGPVNKEEFTALLPGSRRLEAINKLVRWFVGPQFAFDVQVVLRGDSVPPARLRRSGLSACLRRDAWLIRRPRECVADDAVFNGT